MSPTSAAPSGPLSYADAARRLSEIGRRFYARGWMLGTSGNLSAVVARHPLRLAITRSSVPKGGLTDTDILEVDAEGARVGAQPGHPSAETRLHCVIAQELGAGAVLHTHSVWSTILSERYASDGALVLGGYEMLKGFAGVTSHEHRELVPILANDQDMRRLGDRVSMQLREHPAAHVLLLQRHGLYAWGDTLDDAERHVEIAEFLFEVAGRQGSV